LSQQKNSIIALESQHTLSLSQTAHALFATRKAMDLSFASLTLAASFLITAYLVRKFSEPFDPYFERIGGCSLEFYPEMDVFCIKAVSGLPKTPLDSTLLS
jgi:hypothetical protein